MPEGKRKEPTTETECAVDGMSCLVDAVMIDDKVKRSEKAVSCVKNYKACAKKVSKREESQRLVKIKRLETALEKKLKKSK
jgi:hypothetical protein